MADAPAPILHHYASSPFAEKVRLALGLKQMAWASCQVAPLPPRPLLDKLTGGYRRIPVLQIGADIFCDTHVILPALERLRPEPSLYAGASAAVVQASSFNWERAVWLAAIGVRVHAAEADPPADFLRDRTDDYLYVDMSKTAMAPKASANIQHMRAQLAWLVDILADGRRFIFGDEPGALDLSYYQIVWLMRGAGEGTVDAMLGLDPVVGWIERIAALGHGRYTTIGADEALAVAKRAEPLALDHIGSRTAEDPEPDTLVTVTPDDFARVPVAGTLVAADDHETIIRCSDPETGDLHLHFPRAGFVLSAA